MVSFLEKLKKGMGIKVSEEELKEVEKEIEVKPLELEIKELKKPKRINLVRDKISNGMNGVKEKMEEKKNEIGQGFAIQNLGGQEGQLAVDVFQTDSEIVIQSAIAGVKPEDLDISIEADNVLIKGNREMPDENKEKNYFYQECYWGPFSRQIILSEETDPGRAEAIMKEGVLTIRIPKIERKKKTKISIKT